MYKQARVHRLVLEIVAVHCPHRDDGGTICFQEKERRTQGNQRHLLRILDFAKFGPVVANERVLRTDLLVVVSFWSQEGRTRRSPNRTRSEGDEGSTWKGPRYSEPEVLSPTFPMVVGPALWYAAPLARLSVPK